MATLKDIASTNPWVAELLEDPEVPHVTAADRIGSTSEAAVRRYRKRLGWEPSPPSLALEDPDTPVSEDSVEALEAQVEMLQSDNRRLYKAYTAAKQRGDEYIEAVYRAAKDAAVYTEFPDRTSTKVSAVKHKKGEEVALAHITDWQGGKKTVSYDFDVLDDRVKRLAEKIYKITEIQRTDHPVHTCHVLATGDMVEGVSIFPGQVYELDADLFTQMFRVADLMEWFILQMTDIFDVVDVTMEWGNHGRIGRKSDGFKPSDNIDRMVYEIVRRSLTGKPSIGTMNTSDLWYQHFTIGNYKGMAIHGDEIKSFGGNVPAYGILRKGNAWATGVVPEFHDIYIGHYHQSMQLQLANGGSVYMAGSTESDNIYAAEFVAATGRPSQRLNFVDPIKGQVTSEYRLWLD